MSRIVFIRRLAQRESQSRDQRVVTKTNNYLKLSLNKWENNDYKQIEIIRCFVSTESQRLTRIADSFKKLKINCENTYENIRKIESKIHINKPLKQFNDILKFWQKKSFRIINKTNVKITLFLLNNTIELNELKSFTKIVIEKELFDCNWHQTAKLVPH